MFGAECGIVIFIVSLVCEIVGWIVHRLRQQRQRDTIASVRNHLASQGWFWDAKWLAYLDTTGLPATGEELREAMKDFE